MHTHEARGIDGRPSVTRRSTPRPDFNQLETFLKVAETRSFVGAAHQLGISQPAVSQTIAKLEEIFGADLFERRRGAPVALTPIGRAILRKAKLLLFTVDQQIDHALATAKSAAGLLTIGIYSGLVIGPLHAAIAEFHLTRPDVQMRFIEASPNDLHRQLNEHVVDIIFVAEFPDLGVGANVQEHLWDEPLMVAIRDDHPLTAIRDLRWSDLATLTINLQSQQVDLSAYRAVAARMGNHLSHCDLHDVSRGALIELVRMGFGAAISFASDVAPREGIIFKQIVEDNAEVGIDAIWPRGDRNPLRHRLLSLVRKHAADGQSL